MPNNKGAINYARNLHISNELPTIKSTLYFDRHGSKAYGAIFIRILGPLCIILGLIFSALALKDSILLTAAFGTQSRLVDAQVPPPGVTIAGFSPGITDQNQYNFVASSHPNIQQWNIRAGQWGQRFDTSLLLPNATQVPENAMVFVKNTNAEWKDELNQWQGPNKNLIVQPTNQNETLLNTISLSPFQDKVFIAAKDLDGIQKWYPALLMDGAI